MKLAVEPHVLSPSDCDGIVRYARPGLLPADVLTDETHWRTAESAWLPPIGPVVALTEHATGLNFCESMQVVRYGVGGHYDAHHDFFHPGTDYYERCMAQGGQRAWSVMFGLSDDYEGGMTEWPQLGITVRMRRGMMCAWTNLREDGTPDHDSIHAGMPVTAGEKWIGIVFVREHGGP